MINSHTEGCDTSSRTVLGFALAIVVAVGVLVYQDQPRPADRSGAPDVRVPQSVAGAVQAQMEMMQGWMGMAQGAMRQIPGMGMRR